MNKKEINEKAQEIGESLIEALRSAKDVPTAERQCQKIVSGVFSGYCEKSKEYFFRQISKLCHPDKLNHYDFTPDIIKIPMQVLTSERDKQSATVPAIFRQASPQSSYEDLFKNAVDQRRWSDCSEYIRQGFLFQSTVKKEYTFTFEKWCLYPDFTFRQSISFGAYCFLKAYSAYSYRSCREFIKSGADCNVLTRCGEYYKFRGYSFAGPILFDAVGGSSCPLDIIQEMVKGYLGDINQRFGKKKQTLLHRYAAVCGASEGVVKILLDAGADCTLRNVSGETPLHLAARSGNERVAKRLLDAGAVVDQRSLDGRTPLWEAACRYYYDCSYNAHSDPALVMLLLDYGADATLLLTRILLLHKAAKNGHRLLVEKLVDAGAEVNKKDLKGHTPLSLAVNYYHTIDHSTSGVHVRKLDCANVIVNLLNHGANLCEQVNTFNFLRTALARTYHGQSHRHLCHLLVEKGVDIGAANASGYTVLMAAVGEAHSITKRYFLNHAIDNNLSAAVRAVDHDGKTLLMHAVSDRDCCADIVTKILQNGVDPNQQCNRGLTALDYAVQHHCQHGVEVLRAHNYSNKGVFATVRDLFCSLLCLSTAVVSLVLLPVGWTMALLLVGAVGLFSLMQWNHQRYYNSLFGASLFYVDKSYEKLQQDLTDGLAV